MIRFKHALPALLLMATASVHAQTYFEGFDDPLGTWTTRWLYQNTNMENYYTASGSSSDPNYRGNNPSGIWMATHQGFNSGVGGSDVFININPSFGASLTSFSFGVDAFNPLLITFRDMGGNVISSQSASGGSFPLTYPVTISASSSTGISQIEFLATNGGGVEGNTAIDNVTAVQSTPEPMSMIALGLGALVVARRRRRV